VPEQLPYPGYATAPLVDLVVRVPHGTTILQSGEGGSSVDLVAEFAWGMPKLAMDEPQLFLGRLADRYSQCVETM